MSQGIGLDDMFEYKFTTLTSCQAKHRAGNAFKT